MGAICPHKIKNLVLLLLVPLLSDSFFEVNFGKILKIFGGSAPKHNFVESAFLPRCAAAEKTKSRIPPIKNPGYGPV